MANPDQLDAQSRRYEQSMDFSADFQKNLQLEVEKIHKGLEAQVYQQAVVQRKSLLNTYKAETAMEKQKNPFSFDNSQAVLDFSSRLFSTMDSYARRMSPERQRLFDIENQNLVNGLQVSAIQADKQQMIDKDEIAWQSDIFTLEQALETGDPKSVENIYSEIQKKQEAGVSGGIIDKMTFQKRMSQLDEKKDVFTKEHLMFQISEAEAEGGPQEALKVVNAVKDSAVFKTMSDKDKTKINKEKIRLQKKMTEGGSLNSTAIKEQSETHKQIEEDFFSGAPKTRIQDYLKSSENLEHSYMEQDKDKTLSNEARKKAFTKGIEVKMKRLSTLVALKNTSLLLSDRWDEFGETVLGKGNIYDKDNAMTQQAQFVFRFYRDLRKRFNHFKGAKDQVDYVKWVQGVMEGAPQNIQKEIDFNVGLIQSSSHKKVGDFINSLPENSRNSVKFAMEDSLRQVLTEQTLRQTLFGTQNPSTTKEQQQEIANAFDFFVSTNNIEGVQGLFNFLQENLISWEGLAKDKAPSQQVFMDTISSLSNINNRDVSNNVFTSLRMAGGTNEEKARFSEVYSKVGSEIGKWLAYNADEFDGIAKTPEALKNLLTHAVSGYLLRTSGGFSLATKSGVKIDEILGFGGIEGMVESMKQDVLKVGPHIIHKNTLETPPKPGEQKVDENTKKKMMLQTHLTNTLNLGRSSFQKVRGAEQHKKFGFDYPEQNPALAKQYIGTILYLAGEHVKKPSDLENFRINGLRLERKEGNTWVSVQHNGEDFTFNQEDLDNYAEEFGGDPKGYWESIMDSIQNEKSGGVTLKQVLEERFGGYMNPQAIEIIAKGFIKGVKKSNSDQGKVVLDKLMRMHVEKSGGQKALQGSFTTEEFERVWALGESQYATELYRMKSDPTYTSDLQFKTFYGVKAEQQFTGASFARHKEMVKEMTRSFKKDPLKGGFKTNWSVDGDTLDMDFDHPHPKVGEGIRMRLTGVNTPEMKLDRVNAEKAQLFLQNAIDEAEDVKFIYKGVGFHGRIVGDLILDGQSVSKMLINEGLGVEYNYREKRK